MSSLSEARDTSPIIHIPEEWSDAADAIAYDSVTSPPPIVLVCGPRNSGKTTFSRYLLNILLRRSKKVGYLDADVGQPEFTTPGFVSLTLVDKLTPDLTIPCLKTPERCFFFGDISSKRDPKTYLKYISTLYEYYRKEYCTIKNSGSPAKTELPLIVNTPGWVKGVGYDILVDMVRHISPTHVVKINISSERKNLPAGAFWLDDDYCGEINLIEINSARQDSFNKSMPVQKDAGLLRDLRIMAYFRQCFSSDLNITTIKELAKALASHPPYQVPISSIKIRHLHCQVPYTEIFYSLNASMVGLAVSSEQLDNVPSCVGLDANPSVVKADRLHIKDLAYILIMVFSCLDFIKPGIVRGIDTLKGLLYIITPVPPSILEKVDLLLQGFIEIPTCLLQVQACMSPYMSQNVLPTS